MYCSRASDHTCILESMSAYQIFRNCQCLNDLRARTFDLDTVTIWLLTFLWAKGKQYKEDTLNETDYPGSSKQCLW